MFHINEWEHNALLNNNNIHVSYQSMGTLCIIKQQQ